MKNVLVMFKKGNSLRTINILKNKLVCLLFLAHSDGIKQIQLLKSRQTDMLLQQLKLWHLQKYPFWRMDHHAERVSAETVLSWGHI